MNVCVQGLWHLGSVTSACVASLGNRVVGLDFDTQTIERLANGAPPVFEPGLEGLVKDGLASGRLSFTSRPEEAVQNIEVLWITYDTPVDGDDNADVEFVLRQIDKTLPYLTAKTIVLISSQMPVGSVRRMELTVKARSPEKQISFACSPENLRLGRAVEIFLNPDRIVAGVRSEHDREKLGKLLYAISKRIEWMSVESAEMTKHAINAFLATCITFANEIASICERVGADAKEVERGLKSESRIGPKAYLSPGTAFAGGTLARDIAFLNLISQREGLVTPVLSSVKPSNDEHRQWIKRKLQSLFPDLSGTKIAIWGLTYKPGTDTLRGSPAVELCTWLISQGVEVCVHDPEVKRVPEGWSAKVTRWENPLAALTGVHALVISTEWPQYREIAPDAIAAAAPGIVILDVGRFLSGFAADSRVRYLSVGASDQA